jgi:hypothetical protein
MVAASRVRAAQLTSPEIVPLFLVSEDSSRPPATIGAHAPAAPPATPEHLAAELALEREQELRWIQLMGSELDPRTGQSSGHFRQCRKDEPSVFESMVVRGVPDACRGRVWYELLDSKAEPGAANRSTVERLFTRAVPSCDRAIQLDVIRAIPEVAMCSVNSHRITLYRILRAYSNADREIGYAPGMSFYAALFVSYMDETNAFWAFWQLMRGNKHEIGRFFSDESGKLKLLNKVWLALLTKRYPKVAWHFRRIHLRPILYTPGWFPTGFQALQLRPRLRLTFFDRQIAFGTRALLSFGLTIVGALKTALETESLETCLRMLLEPATVPELQDWRGLLVQLDHNWLSNPELTAGFKAAQVKEFP